MWLRGFGSSDSEGVIAGDRVIAGESAICPEIGRFPRTFFLLSDKVAGRPAEVGAPALRCCAIRA